jgi:hypothetical protein
MYVIGRATSTNNGYKMAIAGNGSAYAIALTVMGGATITVNAGTISSGYYVCVLTLNGTAIDVAVQRSHDSLWLTSTAVWTGAQANCIAISDATYTASGRVLIGGSW